MTMRNEIDSCNPCLQAEQSIMDVLFDFYNHPSTKSAALRRNSQISALMENFDDSVIEYLNEIVDYDGQQVTRLKEIQFKAEQAAQELRERLKSYQRTDWENLRMSKNNL